MKKILICFILLYSLSLSANENQSMSDTGKGANAQNADDPDGNGRKKWGITPIGMPYYTSDTSVGIGGQIIYYYNPNPDDPSSKTNSASFYGTITLLKQAAFGVSGCLFAGDYFKITGLAEFSKFPGFFWGIGPDTNNSAKEKYTPMSFLTKECVLYKVVDNLYIGPAFTFFNSRIVEKKDNGLLAAGEIPGSRRARSTGIGVNLNWDSTDSGFYPRKGCMLDIKDTYFLKSLGSSYEHHRFEFDARCFLQIHDEHIIGFQFVSVFTGGTVPLHSLAELGSNTIMRGYLAGRYRDKNSIAMQTEYRFPLVWRLGGTLFAGAGAVSHEADKFRIRYIHKAAGAGIRFNVDESQHINVRFDAGINENREINVYFLVKEAF